MHAGGSDKQQKLFTTAGVQALSHQFGLMNSMVCALTLKDAGENKEPESWLSYSSV